MYVGFKVEKARKMRKEEGKGMKNVLIVIISLVLVVTSLGGLAIAKDPVINIQQFPSIGDMYKMLNPADPYKTVVSGLFRQTVKVGNGERSFLVYIAKDNAQYQPYLVIIPEANQNPVKLLQESGWKEVADAHGMILIITESPDGKWNLDRELEYLERMYALSAIPATGTTSKRATTIS
jgi:hypothetical protein